MPSLEIAVSGTYCRLRGQGGNHQRGGGLRVEIREMLN